MNRRLERYLALAALALAACGGGGGGGGDGGGPAPTPTPVAPAAVPLSAGNGYTLAARADGRVLAWGLMTGGTAAAGSFSATSPTLLAGLSNIRALNADADSNFRALAIDADGAVFGWGHPFAFGVEVAGGYNQFIGTPARVALLGAVKAAVHCGTSNGQSFGLRADGSVAYVPSSYLPTATGYGYTVGSVSGLPAIAALAEHESGNSCRPLAIGSDGSVWRLEITSTSETSGLVRVAVTPARVTGLPAVASAACSGDSGVDACLAVATDGTAWAWGHNNYSWLPGSFDAATFSRLPARMPGLADIEQVVTAGGVAYARGRDGRVWSWGGVGGDGYLRLGRGTPGGSDVPGVVPLPAAARWVAASLNHTVVLLADGSLWAWGRNDHAELGDGTTAARVAPFQVPGVNLN